MERSSPHSILAAYEACYAELIAFVRRKVRCPALAADIVQETWLRAAAVAPEQIVDNPRAYLYRMAGNLATDHLRHERMRSRYLAPDPPPDDVPGREPAPDAVRQGCEELDILTHALRELPDTVRTAFLLYKGEGLSMKEVAAQLRLSPRTVEKHVARALVHCRCRLREAGRNV